MLFEKPAQLFFQGRICFGIDKLSQNLLEGGQLLLHPAAVLFRISTVA